MRQGHIETIQPVCQAPTIEELQKFLEDEKVEMYYEEDPSWGRRWGKRFRKDGPLEWFNETEWEERRFQQMPPFITVLGCIQYSNPVCMLPTVESLLSCHPPYNRFQRVNNESES